MSDHPYRKLPEHCFWRKSIAEPDALAVDPVVIGKFKIGPDDRVATAGSCFAQHIARHLRQAGFNYFVTETSHPLVPPPIADEFGYGLFTARYGNIYTSRQLLQLLHRAYGVLQPVEDVWFRPDGRLIDPFRPQIQPDGFPTMAEYRADRKQHFAAVRQAMENLDYFVFTLGLTECWISKEDGVAYPLCPGVAGGTFDERRHAFVNLKVTEVVRDMQEAMAFVRFRNPEAKFIFTVSPVPLLATAEHRSVLVSTTHSKSVLRVACEELTAGSEIAAYFPSFEIITGNHTRGRYFAEDLRSVTEAGVQHVMSLFMRHYTAASPAPVQAPNPPAAEAAQAHAETMAHAVAVMCDEEALDRVEP